MPLIGKNLHLVGGPFGYHLHDKSIVDFFYKSFRNECNKKEAKNVALAMVIFPSGHDLEDCEDSWRASKGLRSRSFGIASPIGITKVQLQESDSGFFGS